jgi:hypothetical protein
MLILAEHPLPAGMGDEEGNPWGQVNPSAWRTGLTFIDVFLVHLKFRA